MTASCLRALDQTLTAAGARFVGPVAVDFGSVAGEVAAGRRGVGLAVADVLSTVELRGPATAIRLAVPALEPSGRALGLAGRWWCSISPERVLVLDPRGDRTTAAPAGLSAIDLTDDYASLWVLGPLAERLLRTTGHVAGRVVPSALRVRAGRPRATVVRVSPERFLVQVPAINAEELWRTLAAAGRPLGIAAVGRDAQRLLAVADARAAR